MKRAEQLKLASLLEELWEEKLNGLARQYTWIDVDDPDPGDLYDLDDSHVIESIDTILQYLGLAD